jgi:hypothetical protein
MRGNCVWVEARAVPLEVRCGQADWAVVAGWQKLLLSLAVALPIPMLAMSGLAVPLPSAVYRAATAFVESTQGFAGVLTERDVEPLAPTPLRSAPVAGRQAGEPSSTQSRPATRTLPVRARTSGAAPVAAGRTPTVAARRASRLRGGPPAVAKPVGTAPTSAADAGTRPADAGVKTAAPTSPTPSTATEQASRPVEVARVEPVTLPVSPPPAPSPPPPAPPPPALEPVTKTLEPVTKPLEPVTKPVTDALDPITEPVLKTGRLLSP